MFNILKKDKKNKKDYKILKTYESLINQINRLDYKNLNDEELKKLSMELSHEASSLPQDQLLVRAYALVREVARRVLGLLAFDVQIAGAIALHNGNIIEMSTGEGKTLVGIFPAYLNCLTHKGVHILTFNDYLAKRDSLWMGPVFQFLGLSVGYIDEHMSQEDRKKVYDKDIVYATAKEVGFDYLRSFLYMDKSQFVQREFNYAIIDEADSILIDEARIPLVLAGDMGNEKAGINEIMEKVKELRKYTHYETDEHSRNIFLTDEGLLYMERALQCGDLYENKNLSTLAKINSCLHANILLRVDVDYIVQNGKVELIDEFTGRIAKNRKWPDGIQAAIEAKEGILCSDNGQILYSITLQNFIRKYKRLCGMTGTAKSSASEFKEFYDVDVAVIPTNKPCIRIDHGDRVFGTWEGKFRGLIDEIIQVHNTGRPILVGTMSVEESEKVAEGLLERGVTCQILNAKNNELEAKIIENAGMLGTITISTNMAGRGTDIKLGGQNGIDRDKIVALGGLYVIGTNRHESVRIDNQLRGRAGRQGDPGSSRFFISLEDNILVKYGLDKIIQERHITSQSQDNYGTIDSPVIQGQIIHIQKVIDGENFDIRKNLHKYSIINEEQRKIIHKKREDVLFGRVELKIFKEEMQDRYNELIRTIDEKTIEEAERKVTLYYINRCWSDYISYITYVRESVHLYHLGGKVPLDEFNKTAIEAFEALMEDIHERILNTLKTANITKEGINLEGEGLKSPSSTWTYLVDDSAEQLGISPALGNIAAALSAPLYGLLMFQKLFFRKNKN